MDGALGNTDHVPDLFLLELLAGGAFYAIQGLLELWRPDKLMTSGQLN
jgi:hypothetical protein